MSGGDFHLLALPVELQLRCLSFASLRDICSACSCCFALRAVRSSALASHITAAYPCYEPAISRGLDSTMGRAQPQCGAILAPSMTPTSISTSREEAWCAASTSFRYHTAQIHTLRLWEAALVHATVPVFPPPRTCATRGPAAPVMQPRHRAILVEWLVEVSGQERGAWSTNDPFPPRPFPPSTETASQSRAPSAPFPHAKAAPSGLT